MGAQNQGKKNLKRVTWGLNVGHKDRTRINLLSLRLHFSEFYLVNFYFLQVVLFKKSINTIHPPLVFVLLVYRFYTWYQSKDGNGVPFIAIQRRTFYITSTAIRWIQLQLLEV